MKTYKVKFGCGHEGTVAVEKGEYWKVENADRNLCYKCYKKAQEERQKIENEKAQKEFIEAGYPELIGKPADVAQAIRIRKAWIDFHNDIKDRTVKGQEKYLEFFKETIYTKNTEFFCKIGGFQENIIKYLRTLGDKNDA
ncbi:hypothetical protein [Fusobacterium ulcerans]|uniref:hypothetical protein n=1 Tax=Fusobacterium ulcerans TaxID=861 RepID=UPI0010300290|nr:hypothetical protein [Fusobacterium ulcerans]